MEQEELKRKFENKLNTWEAGLKTPEFTEVDCRGLKQDLKIVQEDEDLWDEGIIDNDLRNRFVEVYLQLARKMYSFGNISDALNIIGSAKLYSAENQAMKDRLEALEQEIKNPPKVASPANNEKYEKAAVDINNKENKKIGKNMLFIIVAAVLLLAGGFFAFSGGDKKPPVDTHGSKQTDESKNKKVNVSFAVPEGTEVMVDGEKVDAGGDITLQIGSHLFELQHPLLDFVYDQKLIVANAGRISVYKEIKAGKNLKSVIEKTGIDMMNDILEQACNSDKFTMQQNFFDKGADSNGKISKAYQAMHTFAKKHGIQSMSIEKAEASNIELLNKDGGKSYLVKAQIDLEGQAKANQNFHYTIQTTMEICGDKLLVNSLDSFKAQLVK